MICNLFVVRGSVLVETKNVEALHEALVTPSALFRRALPKRPRWTFEIQPPPLPPPPKRFHAPRFHAPRFHAPRSNAPRFHAPRSNALGTPLGRPMGRVGPPRNPCYHCLGTMGRVQHPMRGVMCPHPSGCAILYTCTAPLLALRISVDLCALVFHPSFLHHFCAKLHLFRLFFCTAIA